jgi:O-antigen biosynthesis protein WbqP
MKRTLDLLAALCGLLIASPVLLLAALAIRLETPGPAIFSQPRVGRGGRLFTCYKLRSMYSGTAQKATHEVAVSSVTPFGQFLRRSKLDEIPQLLNVVLGDMSLVGPRPCLPSQTELIEARRRTGALDVRPGITGLAQIQDVDMSQPDRLSKIDGEYARTQSLVLDLKIVLATLTGSGMGVDRTAG